jgi:hypothetical protein
VTLLAWTQMAFASMLHYSSRLDSYVEFMNQVGSYLACLTLYLMTDYVDSFEQSYFYGWGLIGLVGIFVLINIAIQIVVKVRSACSDIKQKFKRWANKKNKIPKKVTFAVDQQEVKDEENEKSLPSVVP